jgi:histidyl-tRNA synthetase
MKAQMKAASKSGARVAVIVGDDEKAAGTVVVRDLLEGEQSTVELEGVVERIRKVLAS